MSDQYPQQPAAGVLGWVDLYNQAAALYAAGRMAEAVERFRDVLGKQPRQGQALTGLGLALRALGRRGEALVALTAAVRVRPDHADTLMVLAQTQLDEVRIAEAMATAGLLSKLQPGYPGLDFLLGTLQMHFDRQDLAEPLYRRAVTLAPDLAVNYNNLGAALTSQHKLEQGAAAYRCGVLIEPDSPEYNKNLGCCLLLNGELEEGWDYYEWRSKQAVWKWNRNFPGKPQWDGGPLDGKTILVHFEQGLGDSFQYGRYMLKLKELGAKRVYFECQPQLKRILSTLPGVDLLIAHGEPTPDFDVYAPLMSLMRLTRTCSDDTTPGGVPYIHPEPELKARWAARMNLDEFRIGVNWQGNETAKSIPLDYFPAIAAIPGVRLYSLQKVKGLEHLQRLRDRLPIIDWTAEMDGGPDGFIDTAALMSNMDLIITCDTSIAHLAGGMGLRTWMVLKWFADWRWMKDRLDSPWYPTMSIYRMARKNDWSEPMGRVLADLTRLAAERSGRG
jgi:Flp pilus assembly protein TadD